MQIIINTDELLGDETTIRSEVISEIVAALTLSLRKEAVDDLHKAVGDAISSIVLEQSTVAVNLSLDAEFTPVDEYGREGKPTTVRTVIAEKVQQQCTFKTGSYSSDKTAFTRLVEKTVEEEVAKFKKDYVSLVNTTLIQSSFNLAVAKLREACGIKA